MSPQKKLAKKKESANKKSTTPSTADSTALYENLQKLLKPAQDLQDAGDKLSVEDLIISVDVKVIRGKSDSNEEDNIVAVSQSQSTISSALAVGALPNAPNKVEQVLFQSVVEPCVTKVMGLCNEMQMEIRKEQESKKSPETLMGISNGLTPLDPDDDPVSTLDEDENNE